MKKSEPKIILNVSLEGQELEQKIKVAMDDYVEKVVFKNLDETIEKIVSKRVEQIAAQRYGEGLIQGEYLSEYVRRRTNKIIEETVDKNINEIVAIKLSQLVKGNN
ncbi:MAG: hypothetical protein U0M60_23645 [Clostridia bacterium]|nr:hypothetical protein [Clostridia bacterium]